MQAENTVGNHIDMTTLMMPSANVGNATTRFFLMKKSFTIKIHRSQESCICSEVVYSTKIKSAI